MAKQTTVTLIDDLDGSAAEETLSFALDGIGYEIDLSKKNAASLRKSFQPYVDTARRAAPAGRSKTRSRAAAGTGDAEAIRAWARANGHEVSERGRISATLRAAYEADS